ncbi:GxxExxY protein [Flavobacterium sp.]|uniref:GxxExxY protein n=1 Tax=Flavobacterium sp. TaxID=239 RepID=UPI002D1FA23C|nr:GxxExxY protein [Flavobacterium sp.]
MIIRNCLQKCFRNRIKTEQYFLRKRKKEFSINYKGEILRSKFNADFCEDNILEIKAVKEFCNEHIAQILNYLKLADSEVGLLVNFQNKSLQYKRYAL